jgi:hypothetical protein
VLRTVCGNATEVKSKGPTTMPYAWNHRSSAWSVTSGSAPSARRPGTVSGSRLVGLWTSSAAGSRLCWPSSRAYQGGHGDPARLVAAVAVAVAKKTDALMIIVGIHGEGPGAADARLLAGSVSRSAPQRTMASRSDPASECKTHDIGIMIRSCPANCPVHQCAGFREGGPNAV